jgi:hypothetical protein
MAWKRIFLGLIILFAAWIIIDLNYSFKTDLRKLDAPKTARLDGAMWRSYYERKPVKLFLQSAELMRKEFHFPFWRSFLVSFYAAKAAFVFKDGNNRQQYEKALPYVQKYYGLINSISKIPFNADSAAGTELEWWIIRRYRQQHSPNEWETWLAATPSIMYHLPAEKFREYAHLRVEAMLLRDEKEDSVTEADWQKINHLLLQAWQSFENALK